MVFDAPERSFLDRFLQTICPQKNCATCRIRLAHGFDLVASSLRSLQKPWRMVASTWCSLGGSLWLLREFFWREFSSSCRFERKIALLLARVVAVHSPTFVYQSFAPGKLPNIDLHGFLTPVQGPENRRRFYRPRGAATHGNSSFGPHESTVSTLLIDPYDNEVRMLPTMCFFPPSLE